MPDPTAAPTPAPTDAFDPAATWGRRWKLWNADAEYHHDYGIERAWRSHVADWGYPLDAGELSWSFQGQTLSGRLFTLAGLVLWDPARGAVVVGWPA